jgi:hypothetical protein
MPEGFAATVLVKGYNEGRKDELNLLFCNCKHVGCVEFAAEYDGRRKYRPSKDGQ